MMMKGIPNTPFINNYRYKQTTTMAQNPPPDCFPFLSIADGGNGQLVITTTTTTNLSLGVAITISSTTNYNGNYTVLSTTATTFNVSGGLWSK